MNNLKQIGLAIENHVAAQGHFPTGGWGCRWTGDPDRGFVERQPGSWVYNILPYIEQQDLHSLGSNLESEDKKAAAASRMEFVLEGFNCPTRRAAIAFPVEMFGHQRKLVNAIIPQAVSRSDYAINVGDDEHRAPNTLFDCGPLSEESGDGVLDSGNYVFPDSHMFTGLSFPLSKVGAQQVLDGMSNTILVGEKYVMPQCYESSCDRSDWGHVFAGFSPDNYRLAGKGSYILWRDSTGISNSTQFGSAHDVCHFVFCDGSVHAIDYEIDPRIYAALGSRNDEDIRPAF